ncbi:acyltransferase [Infirmifilum sp.]|jgi:carbonic anhydrase/acetyltransferase-like protein (isoleucine patch superfamily)|uniref:acyltransferase n=1 Tax=Infirmifilum sp. TaxID=2856575 RepID=UPI003D0C4AD0
MKPEVSKDKVKARFIGTGTLILGDVTVEEGVWIGYYCLLDGLNAPLIIKRNAVIASFAAIYTHNTMWRDIGLGEKIIAKVIIGENTHIGHGAVIVPKRNSELIIGDHVIVQANAVVSSSIPPWHIYTRTGEIKPIKRELIQTFGSGSTGA